MLSQRQLAQVWAPPCRGPWARIAYPGHGAVSIRPAAAEAFRAKAQVYKSFRYQTRSQDTGGYVCRRTASGASSRHAEGIADDTNWGSNPYGTTRTDRPAGMNAAILAIRTNNGRQVFNNGIFWRGSKDPMHDEIVCSPRDLATGINWNTVAGSRAVDWAAIRRWNAGLVLGRLQGSLPLHPKVGGDAAPWVRALQEALNLVLDTPEQPVRIKVDGRYGDVTTSYVGLFQRNVNTLRRGTITEKAGYFGDQTKWMLCLALRNIMEGRA